MEYNELVERLNDLSDRMNSMQQLEKLRNLKDDKVEELKIRPYLKDIEKQADQIQAIIKVGNELLDRNLLREYQLQFLIANDIDHQIGLITDMKCHGFRYPNQITGVGFLNADDTYFETDGTHHHYQSRYDVEYFSEHFNEFNESFYEIIDSFLKRREV